MLFFSSNKRKETTQETNAKQGSKNKENEEGRKKRTLER